MARRAAEELTRNWMMQNLFGEESEDEDEVEEEVVDSEHKPAVNQPDFHSDEAEGEDEIDGPEIDGEGEVEVDSEEEAHNMDIYQAVSDGGRVQISQERRISDQRVGSELEGYADSEEEAYGQREVVANNSPGLDDTHYADNDNENEVDQARKARRSLEGHQDLEVVRDVFGDSDEDEPAGHGAQNELKPDSYRDPMEETGNYEKDLGREDISPDIDVHYGSEDEGFEQKSKEKPVGPPLELEVALRRPPGHPDTMNLIKVSNIMGIERKAFDAKTYVEEDVFATDESGTKKRIRLENNIVRYRRVKNRDGTFSYESNARFVQWSDGSIQLLIGDEVLDTSVQDARHDQAHLFLRHGKGILQSQGRLLQKMRFMPSSLASKSHRLLTAIVDSHHKKVYKVKNCITNIDPEKEKEEQEKVEGQSIRANELLQRKREKVNNKYVKSAPRRQRQLSPGFLEDVLDEEEGAHEAQREKRIVNAKRNVPRKPSFARGPRRSIGEDGGSEREESEYETDGEDVERGAREEEEEPVEEYFQEEVDAEPSEPEEEDPEEIGVQSLEQNRVESGEDSPPRKTINRRKSVVFDSDED